MKLSKNFSLAKLSKTDTGLLNVPNIIDEDFLKQLCVYILQPIRDKCGRIDISSGYRSKAVNDAVGGVDNSQHKKGQAADIHPAQSTLMDVYRWILSNLEFGSCIIYPDRKFIHVSLPRIAKGNNQALVCMDGKYTVYKNKLKEDNNG